MIAPQVPVTARARTREQGTLTTTVTHTHLGQVASEHSTNDKVDTDLPEGLPHPAYVTVRGGVTRNMGDYNSVKIEVGISMPCPPAWPEADQCFRECAQFVSERVQAELAVATGIEGITA